MPEPDLDELVRSLVGSHDDDPKELIERFGTRAALAAAAATFELAVELQFGSTASASTVSRFVSEVRAEYPNAGEVNPILAEALIRSVLGEEDLLEGAAFDDIVTTEIFLAWAIVGRRNLSDAELDEFVAEVTEYLHQALNR